MGRVMLVVIAAAFLGACASTSGVSSDRAGSISSDETRWLSPWTEDDVARQAAYLALHITDWQQSQEIAKHPEKYTEGNPLLDQHPSVEEVNKYFAVTAVLHTGTVWALPRKYRPAFQWFWIGVEGAAVGINYRAGIRIPFF